MKTILKKKASISEKDNLILIVNKNSNINSYNFSKSEIQHIQSQINKEIIITNINQYNRKISVIYPKQETNANKNSENLRMIGFKLQKFFSQENSLVIYDQENNSTNSLLIVEGILLSNYKFDKYKTKKNTTKLKEIFFTNNIELTQLEELQKIVDSVFLARNLVNEPFSHLTADDLSKEIKKMSKHSGCTVEILYKKEIEDLKMGGLLAVNKGSLDGPTFNVITWKPKNAKNKKPIILIGKGIVYDTGGLSLKPTANSMDIMKTDMGGAAAVIGAMQAISLNKLQSYVIGIVPATDNRPSGNAYAPGDVIKMHNGSTVEVLNTDAEGRMILADALSYSKKYKPELVIDLATLTGSAAHSIGQYGIVAMHNKSEKDYKSLKKSGDETHERLAEFPFWDDYDELINSDIADIKNIGGPVAGAITAGKFLCHFTNYNWIHLDIAGPNYTKTKYGYRGKGATGVGVRLLYHFVKNRYSNEKK
mgnify:CR=1 FL=1|tara:strand:+ start:7314 stop:8750 length:1437 start_codon:yes stop_codon:yes gene_type:complete